MEYIKEILDKAMKTNVIHSIIVIIISFFIYKLVIRFFMKSEKNSAINKRLNNKSRTYIRLSHSILRYVFIILTLLILLQINGINVSSMLAGVGIASAIIGLAVQDALKDIIRGFSILSDQYFSVGDIIEYNGIIGKVTVIGLKSTKMKDILTDNIVSVANRNIEQVAIVSDSLYLNFPMPYELPIDKSEKIVNSIIEKINEELEITNIEYKGVSELADSSIKYLIKITCSPEKKFQIKRDSYGIILRVLAENKIEIPYNQIDVHQK